MTNKHETFSRPFESFVDAYRPQMPTHYWAHLEEFVRSTVLESSPETFEKTRRLLTFLSQFALWCWGTACFDLNASEILVPSIVDAYITSSDRPISLAARERERNLLHWLCERVNPTTVSRLRARDVNASIPESPYTARQVISLRNWASGQGLPRTRSNLRAMLALGAGAGLHPNEIVNLRTSDIEFTKAGTTIHVSGKSPRAVPLLQAWEDFLEPPKVEGGFVISSAAGSRSTGILQGFIAGSRGAEMKPVPQRLRVTWLVTHLNAATPLAVLLEAAGLSSPFSLSRYLQYTEDVGATSREAALRQAGGASA